MQNHLLLFIKFFSSLFIVIAVNASAENGKADPGTMLRGDILSALSQQQVNHFSFVQKKKLAILSKPLVTEGDLLINTGNGSATVAANAGWDVIWNIEKPYRMRYEVYTDHIREVDENGERKIPTGNNPVAAALTDVMSAAFSGKWNNKTDLASVQAKGSMSGWELYITPVSKDLKKLITVMKVHGKQGNIETVQIQESNGDTTEISLRPKK